jgi:hypothetical protein
VTNSGEMLPPQGKVWLSLRCALGCLSRKKLCATLQENCKISASVSRVTCDNDAEPFPQRLDEVTHLVAGHRFRLSYEAEQQDNRGMHSCGKKECADKAPALRDLTGGSSWPGPPVILVRY